MNRLFFRYLFLGLLLVVFFQACVKKTTYPKIPEISFRDFVNFPGDSADLSIKFTDGDGDIGVSESDSTKTLFITYYYQDTITLKYTAYYSPLFNDTLRNSYIVRAPKDSYEGKPISGEVNVRLQQSRHSSKIKRVKYTIYLSDKAGNLSNKIITPELSIP
jgi:hypothetical protein